MHQLHSFDFVFNMETGMIARTAPQNFYALHEYLKDTFDV